MHTPPWPYPSSYSFFHFLPTWSLSCFWASWPQATLSSLGFCDTTWSFPRAHGFAILSFASFPFLSHCQVSLLLIFLATPSPCVILSSPMAWHAIYMLYTQDTKLSVCLALLSPLKSPWISNWHLKFIAKTEFLVFFPKPVLSSVFSKRYHY